MGFQLETNILQNPLHVIETSDVRANLVTALKNVTFFWSLLTFLRGLVMRKELV
jgi:hypothetical protein